MLLLHALSLLAGAATIHLWSELPGTVFTATVFLMAAAAWCWRPLRPAAAFLAGVGLSTAMALQQMEPPLAPTVATDAVTVRGVVVGLPDRDPARTRFRLRVESATQDGRSVDVPRTLRLSWHGHARPELASGQRWQLTVRIRRPRGFANPGGFDYAGWLFREGIGATGHVRDAASARLLTPAGPGLDTMRQGLRGVILGNDGLAHPGILTALAIGDRSGIDDDTWDVLLATGTNHLVAISGLHVGLAALAGFIAGRLIWRLLPPLRARVARPVFAAVTGLVLAAVYAALAGFAIPTQRALIMLAAGLGTLILRRRPAPAETAATALIGVIVFDPLAPMAPGFWLSFGAVAAILWIVCGRMGPARRLAELARLQFAIAVALTPLVVLLFGRTSLAGPIANMAAVPWVSVLVVPPVLAGTTIAPLLPVPGGWLLELADLAAAPLLWFLEHLAAHPWAQLHRPVPGPLALVLAVVGILIVLAPRGLPGKTAATICLLPLVLAPAPRPEPGAVWLDVLDAGDGVATVVRTHSYTLVYGTGPRLSAALDGGSAVLIPFLRQAGSERIDDLVIAQDNARHAGGGPSLVEAFPPQRMFTPPDWHAAGIDSRTCRAGEDWIRDGVRLGFVHPRPNDGRRLGGADLACALRIEAAGGSILLAPDLGRRAQWFMVTRNIGMAADVLVRTPAGPGVGEFVDAVDPEWILHTGGAPRTDTTLQADRAPDAGPGRARGDCGGALHMRILPAGGVQRPEAWREVQPRFWHRGCGPDGKSGTMRAVIESGPS